MGFLDRWLGRRDKEVPPETDDRKSAESATEPTAQPENVTAAEPTAGEPTQPQTTVPAETNKPDLSDPSAGEPTPSEPTEDEAVAAEEPENAAAEPEPEKHTAVPAVPESAAAEVPTGETPTNEVSVPTDHSDNAPTKTPADTPWDAHTQKRLDTYFARLRQEFPNGEIERLNTAHKKLAERGAALRRLIGYEGRLDDFFALGGFTYRRHTGGRPPLAASQTASVEQRLRERFPEDVPTAMAVQQADARLYLDLRAAARRAGCTVSAYLSQFRAESDS